MGKGRKGGKKRPKCPIIFNAEALAHEEHIITRKRCLGEGGLNRLAEKIYDFRPRGGLLIKSASVGSPWCLVQTVY